MDFFVKKYCRKIRGIFINKKYHFKNEKERLSCLDYTGNKASLYIKHLLEQDKPLMISRFGSVELGCLIDYIFHKKNRYFLGRAINYFSGHTTEKTYRQDVSASMINNAGFFPNSEEYLDRFCELMLSDIRCIDVCGSWQKTELLLKKYMPKIVRMYIGDLEPFLHEDPWSAALKDKKVLVIHPFSETIKMQYAKREHLFKNPDVLPEFELKVIKSVQSIAGNEVEYPDWFAALDYMKSEIDKVDFDIALIGCGAYGLPLAAHIKRLGKKALHLGGATQLLFGIKGRRWETEQDYDKRFYNDAWIRPLDIDKPRGYEKVENGCYW